MTLLENLCMKLTEILIKKAVLADLKGQTKSEILLEIATATSNIIEGYSSEEILQVLTERESLGSTGIGSGIAIPHGKLNELTHMVAVFGRSRQGVDFQAQDNEPVYLFFTLLAPENAAGLHLKVLAKLSRLLKDDTFRQNLLTATSAEQIYHIIEKADQE